MLRKPKGRQVLLKFCNKFIDIAKLTIESSEGHLDLLTGIEDFLHIGEAYFEELEDAEEAPPIFKETKEGTVPIFILHSFLR